MEWEVKLGERMHVRLSQRKQGSAISSETKFSVQEQL